MELFRQGTGRGTFGLLYELNCQHLLVQVAGRLRRYASKADPRDVLQEVFFNIYRYPHRFNSEREDAFRVWSAMIVRNTVLKHLRSQGHGGRAEIAIEDLPASRVSRHPLPPQSSARAARVRARLPDLPAPLPAPLLDALGARRRALQLVEVEVPQLPRSRGSWIKLENLKMVIFRARRRSPLDAPRVRWISPDCRPARRRGQWGTRTRPVWATSPRTEEVDEHEL
jgi:DNA-directed RNA polymerase specialized sigma24 family protein